MPKRSPENQEIVRLLAKLKEDTPDYPADLLETRKFSFLKQVVDVHISGGDHPGGGGSGSSRTGQAALRGGATFLGISLKTALAIGAVLLMLAAGYLFREQIVGFLADNGLITSEETAAPLFAPTPVGSAPETPTAVATASSGEQATQPAPGPGNTAPGGTSVPPAQGTPANVFQYLLCILRSGADNCR